MNNPEATTQALAILRNGDNFQWYIIPLLMVVFYIYCLSAFSHARASGNAFNSRKKLMNKKILPKETAAKISGSFFL